MKKFYLSIVCTFFSLVLFSQEVTISSFASGFNSPVVIKHAGDARLFIVEQGGIIKILNDNGTTNSTNFLNIDPIVSNSGNERGLLGLAFHPNYATNGFFYVNYINNAGDTVISRFNVSAGDPDVADSSSEQILMTISQPFSNHNGGDLAFGPDGFLYIATGDGGSGGDPDNYSQRLNTLLGKLLRIDVDNGSPYSSPSSNPYVNDGDANTLEEIWAYGLRNPWRFSFDRQTDDLWIADVGQNAFEEINMVSPTAAGLNYGWRCREGMHDFDTSACNAGDTYTEPIAEYSHSGSGEFKCSITGGYRYRGTAYANFSGLYFFADICSDEIGYLQENGSSWDMVLTDFTDGGSWSTFGEDINGELYIASLANGSIYKLVDGSLGVDEYNLSDFKMYPNPAKNSITLNIDSDLLEQISFYDLQGKLIKEIHQFTSNTITVSTKNFANGMYLIEVLGQNGDIARKKLIIQ